MYIVFIIVIEYIIYPKNKIPTLKLVFNIFTPVSIVNIFLSVFSLELYTLQNICGTIFMANIYTPQKPHHQSDTLKVQYTLTVVNLSF